MTDDPFLNALKIGHQLRRTADGAGPVNATAVIDQQATAVRNYFAEHGIDLTDRATATAVLVTALYCHDSTVVELSRHHPCPHSFIAEAALNFVIATLAVVVDPAGEHA